MGKKFLVILVIMFSVFCSKKSTDVSADRVREYANDLYNKGLYVQAVEEYRRYLGNSSVPTQVRANIIYTIGNIYFERLLDYDNALASYLKVKHFYPESDFLDSVNQKVVVCLERLDKASDAQQVLRETTSLNQEQGVEKKPGEVIAVIGDREITLGDLEFEMNREMEKIPLEMRPEKIGKEEKLSFLKQYLTSELLYNKAKKMGFDRDKEIIEGVFQTKKSLMAFKLLRQEIEEKIKITDNNLELYYEKNKEEFAEKDKKGKVKKQKSFKEVKEDVYQKVAAQEQQKIMDDLLEEMMKTQGVKIFTDKVK